MEVLWLSFFNMILVGTLVSDRSHSCHGHALKAWVSVLIPVNFLLIGPNILLQLNMSKFSYQIQRRQFEPTGLLYMSSRILNCFYVIWSLVGIVWTFKAQECASQIPAIYTVCFILAVGNSALLGICLLVCFVMLPGYALSYVFCPRNVGIEKIQKASPKLINKVTKMATFSSNLSIPTEDSSCAICLCEYEEGEEIRFLHCNHHFHSECVTDWLLMNKTCPYCKREIDKKISEEEQPLSLQIAT